MSNNNSNGAIQTYALESNAQVLAVRAVNGEDHDGSGIRIRSEPGFVSTNLQSSVWRCIFENEGPVDTWTGVDYNDSAWPLAIVSRYPDGDPAGAPFIWAAGEEANYTGVNCRGYVGKKYLLFWV